MAFRDRLPWLNPFHRECVTVRTQLPSSESLARVREAVVSRYSPRTWWLLRDERTPVIGAVRGNRFWMQRIHAFVSGWDLPQADGTVTPSGTGSEIHVCIGLKRINAVLHALGVGFAPVIAIASAQFVPNHVVPTAFWVLLPAAATWRFVLDRLLFAPDVAYLHEYLAGVVSPRPAWHLYASAQTG